MTDLRRAAEMALEALEDIKKYVTDDGAMPENWDAYHEKPYFALEALRQALTQPEQEPTTTIETVCALLRQAHDVLSLSSLPPTKPWVSLTDEESSDIYNAHHNTYGECITSAHDLVLDIEAKLKEKNGGV